MMVCNQPGSKPAPKHFTIVKQQSCYTVHLGILRIMSGLFQNISESHTADAIPQPHADLNQQFLMLRFYKETNDF